MNVHSKEKKKRMYTERAKEIKRLCTQREQRKEKSEIKWSE